MPRIKRTAAKGGNESEELSLSPLKARSKKQDEKDKSKQRILDSATKLFAQKGYDGVGIREICKDAGANICMISYFWGGKEGLYQGIIENLVEKQTELAKQFINFDVEPNTLTQKEQIDLLHTIFEKMITFAYSGNISSHIIRLLLAEQHDKRVELISPLLEYIRKLLASIFERGVNDEEIVYKFLFIISQLNSAMVMPRFSLGQLNKKSFDEKDVQIIKNNMKLYINALINEVKG